MQISTDGFLGRFLIDGLSALVLGFCEDFFFWTSFLDGLVFFLNLNLLLAELILSDLSIVS